MSRGEVATAILKAIMAGEDYPPAGVPDTPRSRQVWDAMKREVGQVPAGDTVDIPSDWTQDPRE